MTTAIRVFSGPPPLFHGEVDYRTANADSRSSSLQGPFVFAAIRLTRHSFDVSTLAEIQDAVTKLSTEDKNALALWLSSQTDPELSPGDEERLLRSFDKAIRDIEAGHNCSVVIRR